MWKVISCCLVCLVLSGFCTGSAQAESIPAQFKSASSLGLVWTHGGVEVDIASKCAELGGSVDNPITGCYNKNGTAMNFSKKYKCTDGKFWDSVKQCTNQREYYCSSGYTLKGTMCEKNAATNDDDCSFVKGWAWSAKPTVQGFCADTFGSNDGTGCWVEKYETSSFLGYVYTGSSCSKNGDEGETGESEEGDGDDGTPSETPQKCSAKGMAFKVDNGKGVCVEPEVPSDCRSNETFGQVNGKNKCIPNSSPGDGTGGESSTPGGETGDGGKDGTGTGDGEKGNGDASSGTGETPGGNGSGTGGSGTGTDGSSEGKGEESNCPSWAKGLCDALNWNPGEPDLGGTDGLPGKNTEEIGIGNFDTSDRFMSGGYCPKPRSFEINMPLASSRFELSYQPFCDFAGLIRFIVITVALLVGARIVFTKS